MAAHYFIDGVEVVNKIVIGEEGLTESASSGEGSFSTVTIHDPTGALDPTAWQFFWATEDQCAEPRSYTGLIVKRSFHDDSPYDGVGRRIELEIADLNSILKLRTIRGDTGKRPAESDTGGRIPWLLASEFLNDLVFDNGDIIAQVINFNEADVRGSQPVDVLAEMAPVAGCTFFLFWDSAALANEEISLFYDKPGAAVRSSTLRISNDPADADAVTIAPMDDWTVDRTGEDVNSGVVLRWRGGELYKQRAQTITDFISRDGATEDERIGRLSTANSVADAWLTQFSTEGDTIDLSVTLTDEQLNLILQGQRIEVKLTQVPGYESFVWTRITKRGWTRVGPEHYLVRLTMSLRTPPSQGGGGTGGLPWQAGEAPTLVQSKTGFAAGAGFALDATPTAGHLLLAFVADRDGGADITVTTAGWTKIARATNTTSFVRDGHAYYRVADGANPVFSADGPINALTTTLMEWDGSYGGTFGTADTVASTTNLDCGGSVTPAAGANVAIVGLGIIGFNDADYPGTTVAPDGGVTEVTDTSDGSGNNSPGIWVGYLPVTAASGSHIVGGTISGAKTYCGITVVVEGSGGVAPATGQPLPPQVPTGTVDGSNTAFTAPHPFADGSAKIYIDGDYQPGEPTTYDGATGDFTLSFAPRGAVADEPAEAVRIEYQGR